MMKRTLSYLLGAVLLIAVASCSSSKKIKSGAVIGNLPQAQYMEEVISRTSGWDVLTAKMTMTVDLNEKGPTKVGGTLRIKKGEVIQLSLAPLLGIEVARAEITPDGILVMDRMNKRYVQVPFDELKTLARADLDFHILQALFLNELFLPGKKNLVASDVEAFSVRTEHTDAVIEVKHSKRFGYRFRTSIQEGQLTESHIALNGTQYGLTWKYDNFRPLEAKSFPNQMAVAFEGADKPIQAAFSLSRLSVGGDWDTHTEVPAKYKKVELHDLLKQFMK